MNPSTISQVPFRMEPNPVLAIPECLEHTIHHVSGSRASRTDLLSCALVSKSWVLPAQSRLFKKITLDRDPQKAVVVCDLLKRSLGAAPHLAHFIQHLQISLNIDVLKAITEMALPNLEELSVLCTDAQYRCRAEIETRFLMQSLLRLPTIRRVLVSGIFHSVSIIQTYFENCAPGIRSLELDAFVQPNLVDSDLPASALAHVASKIQLDRFILSSPCEGLDAWIFDSHCPFGFACLRTLHIGVEVWPSLQSILAPSLPSIEELRIVEFSNEVDMDLSGLTALKRLEFQQIYENWNLPDLLTVLQSLPSTHRVHTLGLWNYSVSAGDERKFKDFDAAIASMDTMHSLRRVEIHILETEWDSAAFESCFPALSSKGYLYLDRECCLDSSTCSTFIR
ncbi:hypothetical protein DFH08DRAFT_839143 [Mycena albidolilacea]|uniref:F-box domain-containing protein n=1 Tax=Mycena albidolilacea TaxID=1033008 RepID=A0AAD7APG4_9AGAR|nr:hypothetical protein DFH08DRAFT_839143 [Mycena albidolilacea]